MCRLQKECRCPRPRVRPAHARDGLLGEDPEQVRRDVTDTLRELLDESFEHLLFAHGDPIVGEGHATLRRFVDEQQSAR